MHKIILFSHGMGVLRDNRGLFPYLVERISKVHKDVQFILFDYNDIDEVEKTVTVKPFSEQAVLLQNQIDTLVKDNPEAQIYIVGQSQGCLIPAFCNVQGIHKVVGISPFFHTSMNEIIKRYTKSGENEVNFTGVTKRKRSDGTTTVMPASYWTERFNTNVEDLYNNMAQKTKLTLICALQDDIMDITNETKVKYARIINTDGDHDFSNEFRAVVGDLLVEELGY